jgi:hypothetical protein
MLAGLLGAFRRCDRGNVAMLFALSAVPLFGAAGMAIDYARAVDGRTQLQIALDGAVLAGAVASGKEVATAQSFFDAAVAPAKLEGASASFDFSSGALTGAAHAVVPSTLLKVMHIDTVEIGANAAVKIGGKGGVCILVLDPNANQSFLANSGARVTGPDCEIHVRSTANPAAIFNSGTSLDVKTVCVKGANTIQNGGPYKVVQTSCSTIDDPFAGNLPGVTVPGCAVSNQNYNSDVKTATLPAGNYCNMNFNNQTTINLGPGLYQNINFNGASTINLSPGLYIFKGRVNINSGSTVNGTGVTLYYPDSNSYIQFNSNVTTNLTAPTSGSYKGILFFEAPNLAKTEFAMDDTRGSAMKGLIYWPSRKVTINSTSNVTADQVSLVVNQLILNNTNWKFSPNSSQPMGGSTGNIALIR